MNFVPLFSDSDLLLGCDEHAFEHARLDQAFHGICIIKIICHGVHGQFLRAILQALQDEPNSHLLNIDISNKLPSYILIQLI